MSDFSTRPLDISQIAFAVTLFVKVIVGGEVYPLPDSVIAAPINV